MVKRYRVRLSDADRRSLQKLVRSGKAPARSLTHARILLKADEGDGRLGWRDLQIAEALQISVPTIGRVRRRYMAEGLEAALHRRPPRNTRLRKLDGHAEARLIALSRGSPPKGRDRWTMQLLADTFVERYAGPPISDELVRRTLKTTSSSGTWRPGGD
jgi:transposase